MGSGVGDRPPLPPRELGIKLYFHCAQCVEERPAGISPQEYARNDVGWTVEGLQVWCRRHNCNIIHIDFAGAKFHANTAP